MRRLWSCWTRATRSRPRPDAARGAALAVAALALTGLAACSPTAPPGVDKDVLDAEVSRAIGDPATCVMIADAGSGKVLYRYNTATVCARELDGCARNVRMTVRGLLDATAKDRQTRRLSCITAPDGSRSVGWSSGPIAGTSLVYAAAMEGDHAFPGLMIGDRLRSAFARAKVSPPAP